MGFGSVVYGVHFVQNTANVFVAFATLTFANDITGFTSNVMHYGST